MSFSVVIPTYNAESDIESLFNSIEMQSVKPEKLVVIDSSSSDNTVHLCKKHGVDPITIKQSEFNHGGTRNYGIRQTVSDIIILLTQDAILADKFSFENLISSFSNIEISAAYGRQLPHKYTGYIGAHLREYNYNATSSIRGLDDVDEFGIKTIFFSDSFSAYRRKDLEKIGYFKDDIIFGEDTLACANFILSGKKVSYVSDALVYHSHDYSLVEEFKRSFDIGSFHQMEKRIFCKFPSAEGEGLRYVMSAFRYLIANRQLILIAQFPFRVLSKLVGYKLGKQYEKIPKWLVLKLSMSPWWWKNR